MPYVPVGPLDWKVQGAAGEGGLSCEQFLFVVWFVGANSMFERDKGAQP